MNQEVFLEQEKELDIKDLLLSIKKHLVLIIVLPIIFSGIAEMLNSYVSKPSYVASVSIIISKDTGSELTESDVSLYQSLTKTYTEIAKSDVVAERAKKDGKIEGSLSSLQSSLTVNCKEGTQVLYMSVISGKPDDAVKKVEALAQAFLDESKRLLPSGNINIMDHAKMPQSPISSNRTINIFIAFGLGLLTSTGLAILIEYIKDTVRSEKDIEKAFGIPILGVIPKNR